jgi:hypothetical protein
LVLTQNESTESGHSYADELGIEYEYPTFYRRRIRTGEPLVYYRGRRRADGTLQPQVYLGAGVVGQIRPSGVEGRLICEIEDFVRFPTPVPFKHGNEYLEPLGKTPPSKAGLYSGRASGRSPTTRTSGSWPLRMRSTPTAGAVPRPKLRGRPQRPRVSWTRSPWN